MRDRINYHALRFHFVRSPIDEIKLATSPSWCIWAVPAIVQYHFIWVLPTRRGMCVHTYNAMWCAVLYSVYDAITKLICDDKSHTDLFQMASRDGKIIICCMHMYIHIEHLLNRAKCRFFFNSSRNERRTCVAMASIARPVCLTMHLLFPFFVSTFSIWKWKVYISRI